MASIFVGEVAVGVVPDAKNFNNDIRRQIFPDADNLGREFGAKLGRGIQEAIRIYVDKIKADLRNEFKANVGADTSKARDDIDAMRAEQEARPIKLRAEVDSNSVRNMGSTLAQNIASSVAGVPWGGVGITIAAGIGAALAPALLPALSGGLIGAIGLALADPKGLKGVMKDITGTIRKAVAPLKPLFHDVLRDFGGFVKTEGPAIRDLFKASIPFLAAFVKMIEDAGRRLLPVFTQSLQQMTPFLPLLAQGVAQLVSGIGGLIKAIGPQGMRDSAEIFIALMRIVEGVLIGTGAAVNFLSVAIMDTAHWIRTVGVPWIVNTFDDLRHHVAVIFDGVRHDIVHIWDLIFQDSIGRVIRGGHDIEAEFNIWRHVTAVIFDGVRSDIVHVLDLIASAFRTTVSVIGKVWGTLKGIFLNPVQFLVNTVYDNGIARLWNDVMGAIHGPKLPVVRMARGGRLPGYGGGDIQPALLEPGETVVDKDRSRILAPIFRAAGVPGYQHGGIIGSIGSFFGSLFGGASDVFRIVAALTTGNATAAENAFSGLFHTHAAGDLATMMLGIPKAIVSSAVHFVINSLDSLLGGGGGVSGNVAQYAGMMKQVMVMLGQPVADFVIGLHQMMTESGGNPYAVNKWDINWLEGHPSVGLLQVIAGTFDRYAGPFRNVGPFAYGVSENPMANIFAGMNYAVHEYGSAPGGWTNVLGQGHGYDEGGWWPSGTFGWNMSGRSELVLTQDQAAAIGGDHYHFHLDGYTNKILAHEVQHAMRVNEIARGRMARMGRRQ